MMNNRGQGPAGAPEPERRRPPAEMPESLREFQNLIARIHSGAGHLTEVTGAELKTLRAAVMQLNQRFGGDHLHDNCVNAPVYKVVCQDENIVGSRGIYKVEVALNFREVPEPAALARLGTLVPQNFTLDRSHLLDEKSIFREIALLEGQTLKVAIDVLHDNGISPIAKPYGAVITRKNLSLGFPNLEEGKGFGDRLAHYLRERRRPDELLYVRAPEVTPLRTTVEAVAGKSFDCTFSLVNSGAGNQIIITNRSSQICWIKIWKPEKNPA